MLGAILGNYRVVEPLGQGGMGMVYVGRHERLGHRVAVKVLRPEMSRNADMVRRFFNEAQAAAAIRNPGIVQVFDFGTTSDGRAYFVMELLEGQSLSARIEQRRLEAAECCRIARQIANVLQSAHEAGITHRDLKPDNLFLIPDPEVFGGERVKVLDFGIAKLASEVYAAGVQTRADLVMGTPSYMSPEQCRGAGAVDTRADIYSLGCILFKMMCGQPPFVGEGAGDIIGAHLHVPPPDLQQLAPDAPPGLAALVAKMLAKKPDARPQTMAAVSQALEELLHALGGSPVRTSGPLPMVSPATPTGRDAAVPAPPLATPLPASPPAPPRRDAPPLPVRDAAPVPQPAQPPSPAPVPTPLPMQPSASTSTTLGGAAGMSSAQPRAGSRRLPFVLGGLVVVGAIAAVAIVLATGDSGSQKGQISYDQIAAAAEARPAEAAGPAGPAEAAGPAGPAVPAVPGVEDAAVAVAPAPAAPPIAVDAAEPTAPPTAAAEPESDCRGLEVARKWAELAQCAKQLEPSNPQRAAELKSRAVEEAKTAPRIAAFEAALRDRNLKRAKAELDQIWAEALDYGKLKTRYAVAEAQAITELAAQLDRAKTLDCEAYNALLAKERAAKPTRVAAEAARKVPCTKCDADALVEKAKDAMAKRRYAASLDFYDLASQCRPGPTLVRQAFEIACDNHALVKAKSLWKRLPAASRPEAKVSCARNGITEAQLNAP